MESSVLAWPDGDRYHEAVRVEIAVTPLRKVFVWNTLRDSSRWMFGIGAAMCFALSGLVSPNSGRPSAAHAGAPAATGVSNRQIAKADRSDQPLFRLGDAATPFGWSTVVGDFNEDGRPDVAVADRIARRTSRHAFRLEFSISGRAPQRVTFEASQDAVTISVADVDRDNDLDIVVGTPLSGETVGIWLNDGHGHFTAGDARQLPATFRPLQSFNTTDPIRHSAAFEVSPRRTGDGLPTAFRTSPPPAGHRPIVLHSHTHRSATRSARTSPRAPPTILLDALS